MEYLRIRYNLPREGMKVRGTEKEEATSLGKHIVERLLTAIFWLTRFIFTYYVLEFVVLAFIVTVTLGMEILYGFLVPMVTGDTDFNQNLTIAACFFLFVIGASVAGVFLIEFAHALEDAWSLGELPRFRCKLSHRSLFCMPLQKTRLNPFRNLPNQKWDHLTPLYTTFEKEQSESSVPTWVFFCKALVVLVDVIAAGSQSDGLFTFISFFFAYGIYFGGIFCGLFFFVSFLREVGRFVHPGACFNRKTLHLIKEKLYWGPKNKCGRVALYALFFSVWVGVTALVTITAKQTGAKNDVVIATFYVSFFGIPLMALRTMYRVASHNAHALLLQFSWLVFTIILSLLLLLAFMGTVFEPPCSFPAEKQNPGFVNSSVLQAITRTYSKLPPYHVCSREWRGMSILDFALFAQLAYTPPQHSTNNDCSTVDDQLALWFPNSSWVVAGPPPDNNYLVGFYELYNADLDLSVITVRGTKNSRDVIQDMNLFTEIGLLQAVSFLVPFVNVWGMNFVQDYVYWASGAARYFARSDNAYYNPLLEYVEENLIGVNDLIITGHSLGGAVAQIVGARLNITSIVFESPGTVWSSKKFNITLENINRNVVSVVSEHDLVPLVDYQGGLVQNIRCRYGSARNCHSLKTVACELRNGCQLFNRTFSQCDDWTANPQLAVVYGGATSAGVRAETLSLGVVALLCLAVLYLHV